MSVTGDHATTQASEPLSAANQPAQIQPLKPIGPDFVVTNQNVLHRLINDTDIPTAHWACIDADGSCLLLEAPRVSTDGPRGFRYKCSSCQTFSPNNKSDSGAGRPGLVNQMNTVWKHLCRKEHLDAIAKVGSEEKRRRIAEVVPKLDAIIKRNNSRKKPKALRFTASDVASLDGLAYSDVDAAYEIAFRMGMQGNDLTSKLQELLSMHIRTNQPVDVHMQPVYEPMQTPSSDAVYHTPQYIPPPPPLQQMPPSEQNAGFFRVAAANPATLRQVPKTLQDMYQSTQAATHNFNHQHRPKS